MRIDEFEGKYAHGFSTALDPVLCCAEVNESSAVGFRFVLDTLLFYRMVQGHLRQLRFWAWYGSTSGDASFDFREGDTGKSPALPKQTAKDGARKTQFKGGPPARPSFRPQAARRRARDSSTQKWVREEY